MNVDHTGYGKVCLKIGEVCLNFIESHIEWFGLEGTFKGCLAQIPDNKQGHLQLDQVAQSPIQPDLQCFQGWGIYHHSG